MDALATDEVLMQRYRDGDADAFEILYARHKDSVYRYLLRQCGNPSTAEELMQDVWMGLIRSRDRYEIKARFTTWLYRMAHNRLIDYYRKQKPAMVLEFEASESQGEVPPTGGIALPDNEFAFHQLAKRLLEALDDLPLAQREAFLLREEAGLDLHQAAEVSGVPLEAAKSRLRYAVNKLRTVLTPDA
ncbi:MAG: RNA polymerase sigma factor [Gammaproteobacteria bacterium]